MASVFDASPLEGGFSGETFLVEGPSGPAVLRIYGRDPHRAAIDASLLRLIRDLVPAPRVLDLRRPDPSRPDEAAHLLTTYEPGVRLELVLPNADRRLREALAASIAGVLAALGGMPFLRAGMFVDAELHLSERMSPADCLVDWLELHADALRAASWDAGRLQALRVVCDEADVLLDRVDRVCLVHSDFNAKNILVDPATGAVTAVLDWEYAHAGSPWADLGNLLRLDRGGEWADLVVEHYLARTPPAPANPLLLGYASDLWALIDLAARPVHNAATESASRVLDDLARTGRLDGRPKNVNGE